MQALGADFVAVSGHKMCGPSGIGFLWGRTELLLEMEPFLLGGHMIRASATSETTWAELPAKFEAGTSPIAEAVGLGAAIDYIEAVGLEAIEAHEHALAGLRARRARRDPRHHALRPAARAARRDRHVQRRGRRTRTTWRRSSTSTAIAIRAGHHCCQPLMRKLGVAATNRASFYLYTVPEEIDRLGAAVLKAKELMT